MLVVLVDWSSIQCALGLISCEDTGGLKANKIEQCPSPHYFLASDEGSHVRTGLVNAASQVPWPSLSAEPTASRAWCPWPHFCSRLSASLTTYHNEACWAPRSWAPDAFTIVIKQHLCLD